MRGQQASDTLVKELHQRHRAAKGDVVSKRKEAGLQQIESGCPQCTQQTRATARMIVHENNSPQSRDLYKAHRAAHERNAGPR